MRRISILGSTGSIGVSTLRLLDETGRVGEDYEIVALTGGRNADLLCEQALKFRPGITVLNDTRQWPLVKQRLQGSGLEIACGDDAIVAAAARPVDWVMAAIVGIAGLKPVWAAAGTGAVIALANKESLVCCGSALLERVRVAGGRVLPVDSEHNAIFQVLDARQTDKVSKLILTASGGPFFGRTREQLRGVTVEQALKHPNWSMGAKITIDSATLANKGLEFIEAAILFDMPPDKIDVVIHPQSVIHSLVEYADGSSLAQLGTPDMRVPISYCLGYPDRLAWAAPKLDLKQVGTLSFFEPDTAAFPMLRLAREALNSGLCGVFNAANEVCVQAFLEKRIDFLQVAEFVEMAMMRAQLPTIPSIRHASRDRTVEDMDIALDIDSGVRELVGGFVADARQGA
jgi:1-deoxy-D-xylulose-5-phosphate reductoisomerase